MWLAVEKWCGSWTRPYVRLVWLWRPVRITDRLAPMRWCRRHANAQSAVRGRRHRRQLARPPRGAVRGSGRPLRIDVRLLHAGRPVRPVGRPHRRDRHRLPGHHLRDLRRPDETERTQSRRRRIAGPRGRRARSRRTHAGGRGRVSRPGRANAHLAARSGRWGSTITDRSLRGEAPGEARRSSTRRARPSADLAKCGSRRSPARRASAPSGSVAIELRAASAVSAMPDSVGPSPRQVGSAVRGIGPGLQSSVSARARRVGPG